MNSNKMLKSILIFLLFFSVSCSKADHLNGTAQASPDGDVNRTIIMTTPDECNSFKINTIICLAVILQGKDPVLISLTMINAFEKINNKWTSIDNGIDNKQNKFILYPSDDYLVKSNGIFAQPMFDDRSVPITLRFVVTGNIYQNGKVGTKVSAYADVTLNP
jgi:hypothetical protein